MISNFMQQCSLCRATAATAHGSLWIALIALVILPMKLCGVGLIKVGYALIDGGAWLNTAMAIGVGKAWATRKEVQDEQ